MIEATQLQNNIFIFRKFRLRLSIPSDIFNKLGLQKIYIFYCSVISKTTFIQPNIN